MPHTRTQTPTANPSNIPSIRLITATPSAAGSSEGSTSFEFNRSLEDAWAAIASAPMPLAPKASSSPAPVADAPRKKLVPKKSKLSLLSGLGSGNKDRERARDFSDVVRRVGADCSAKGGFEIYVDPEVGAESGEVLIVKKRKSRAALNGMSWGAKEVTNIPKVPKEKEAKDKGLLKVKADEGQKWWSIGRGRKDSKEKENKISHKPVEYIHDPHPRSKTPEPLRQNEGRARFNSLDAGALLNNGTTRPVKFDEPAPRASSPVPPPPESRSTTPAPTLARSITPTLTRSVTPTAGGLLAPPGAQSQASGQQGSIAIRAMRSVRSLARIGSWAQLKNMPAPDTDEALPAAQKQKERKGTVKEKKKKGKENLTDGAGASTGEEGKKKKKKSTKEKKEKVSEKESATRFSSSSFEAGALTASPGPAAPSENKTHLGVEDAHTLGAKKRSILGLGLPSSMRLPSIGSRVASNASSVGGVAGVNVNTISAPQRLSGGSFSSGLSASSAGTAPRQLVIAGAQGQARRVSLASTLSAGSSLRPLSTTSTRSSLSTGSGENGRAASVRSGSIRWDEEGLETVRERRGAERKEAEKERERKERRTSRESRHSAEGRRRTSVRAVFGDAIDGETAGKSEERERRESFPIVTIEEATVDGHGAPADEVLEEQVAATPVKKARARPVSEQMLGKARPRPMYEDEEGVLSILDAATNDLALLINNLDLQATPSTPGDRTPLRIDALSPAEGTPTANLKASAYAESPLKSAKKVVPMSSVSSLRPYAQSRGGYTKPAPVGGLLPAATIVSKASASNIGANAKADAASSANAARIAQQIKPWAQLVQGLSPVKEKVRAINAKSSTSLSGSVSSIASFRPGHKRTMTPAREPEPELVFQPLKPPRGRLAIPRALAQPVAEAPVPSPVEETRDDDMMHVDELSLRQSTFGRSSGALTPVFKRLQEDEQSRLRAPTEREGSMRSSRGSRLSAGSYLSVQSRRSGGSSRRSFGPPGRSGTLGDMSIFEDGLNDADPDSDVPDELRDLLAGADEELTTSSYTQYTPFHAFDAEHPMIANMRAAPSPPPSMPLPPILPTIQASLVDSPGRSESDGDDNTKASFDWTEELNGLNESGASDRRSFVEQLENAFKTPAKVDLRYDFGATLKVPAPPVPRLPSPLAASAPRTKIVEVGPAAAIAEDWRMAVAADESTSSMGDDVEEQQYEYDSGALSGVVGREESSEMEVGRWDASGEERRLVDEKMPSFFAQLEEESREAKMTAMKTNSTSGFDMDMVMADVEQERIADVPELTMADLGTTSEDSIFARSTSSQGSTGSRPSEGQLDTSFRFGGLPQAFRKEPPKPAAPAIEDLKRQPMTLSDIIPPPAHARRISRSLDSEDLDNTELMDQIMGIIDNPKAATTRPVIKPATSAAPAPTAAQTWTEQEAKRRSVYKAPSRPTSGISFTGLGDSFEEARRTFEYGNDRPAFYPPKSHTANARQVSRRARHARMESGFSVASVSTYGRVLNNGSNDPFGFMSGSTAMPSLPERPVSEVYSFSELEDTFAFRRTGDGENGLVRLSSMRRFSVLRPRQRVDSDASTFSFHAPPAFQGRGHHRRRESNMSVASIAPPISLYNRTFSHHRRNDSTASVSSVAHVRSGAQLYQRHRRDMSDQSMVSDFSSGYLGRPGLGDKMFGERYERPGLGDKMFETTMERGPLTSITASPPESAVRLSFAASDGEFGSSYEGASQEGASYEAPDVQYVETSGWAFDSIIDQYDERRSGVDDSLFDKTGYYGPQQPSMGSDELFGSFEERPWVDGKGNRLQPPMIRSRMSWGVAADTTGVISFDYTGVISPSKVNEEDTMLSMIGGGHAPIPRRAVAESPCPRVEKRKFSDVHVVNAKGVEQFESPSKARIVEKPSLASASSFQFGNERMIRAQRGLLERQSLEDSCLIADGEELTTAYFSGPVFTRPGATTRSRSSTCTTSSSGSMSGSESPPMSSSTGGETPPLSLHHSDGSSVSGSQSSIDLAHIDMALSNATSPLSGILNRPRVRTRARGSGHRRRYSNSHISRSSVYETIDEDTEMAASQHDGSPNVSLLSKKSSPTTRQAVFVVDSDTASFDGHSQPEESIWNDERGIVALRKYYALRDEAQTTVIESKRTWSDTPFSLHAIQNFEAPAEPAGMQALLQYSVQNYQPLPSELRPHRVRSRTSSRASPYPQARISKVVAHSPQTTRTAKSTLSPEVNRRTTKTSVDSERAPVLMPRSINHNIAAAPSLEAIKPFSPLTMDKMKVEPKRENAFGLAPDARPRVPSNARRTALGWSKRSNGAKSSTDQKENQVATGIVTTPGDNLRLNRPRPRGRPTPGGRTPAAQNRAIRI